ncbi:hypothetical protein K2173_013039 [Erythroxylum novogranatense]|uniref:WRKY domain-containing protein n=1 Tax=Erythroxylum novogranatense TaxID=1862640 RepID=A0AAV8S750_9ROSI|nr:hypothetical protein K2173_013039 [Erythroxylum novogranatense]
MENMGDWEQKNLIAELRQGRELAQQLQIHINSSSSSRETREILLKKILASYEKSLSIANFSSSASGSVVAASEQQYYTGPAAIRMSESPPSLSGDDSDRDLKDHDQKDGSRKRKDMPRWTQQVRVSPGMGLEGPLDDGYSWRKYGQKDILGAKYPRGYYRCTHRNLQGCLATKQVQRSDEDPTIFEITYRGRHTCNQSTLIISPTHQHLESQEPNKNMIDQTQQQHKPQTLTNQHQSQELLINFRTGLKVITDTEDLDSMNEQSRPSFHFPSTSTVKPETHMFSPSTTDNSFTGNFSPSLISPSTPGTNYFSVSATGIHHSYGGTQSFHQSELTDHMISAAASSNNSPTVGFDFPLGNLAFDPNFTFGNNSGYIP